MCQLISRRNKFFQYRTGRLTLNLFTLNTLSNAEFPVFRTQRVSLSRLKLVFALGKHVATWNTWRSVAFETVARVKTRANLCIWKEIVEGTKFCKTIKPLKIARHACNTLERKEKVTYYKKDRPSALNNTLRASPRSYNSRGICLRLYKVLQYFPIVLVQECAFFPAAAGAIDVFIYSRGSINT